VSDIVDRQVAAITQCVRALSGLDLEEQANVLRYLITRNAHDRRVAEDLIDKHAREGQ
jgi:hypothetical protein